MTLSHNEKLQQKASTESTEWTNRQGSLNKYEAVETQDIVDKQTNFHPNNACCSRQFSTNIPRCLMSKLGWYLHQKFDIELEPDWNNRSVFWFLPHRSNATTTMETVPWKLKRSQTWSRMTTRPNSSWIEKQPNSCRWQEKINGHQRHVFFCFSPNSHVNCDDVNPGFQGNAVGQMLDGGTSINPSS